MDLHHQPTPWNGVAQLLSYLATSLRRVRATALIPFEEKNTARRILTFTLVRLLIRLRDLGVAALTDHLYKRPYPPQARTLILLLTAYATSVSLDHYKVLPLWLAASYRVTLGTYTRFLSQTFSHSSRLRCGALKLTAVEFA